MLRDIQREVKATRGLIGKDALDPTVMAAMRSVPRAEFVPPNVRALACDNGPLSIGYGQTISQPYIVALMTDLLSPRPDAVVLEVGTGSGYQAAVLSKLVTYVYSTEIIPKLGEQAAIRLKRLGYNNVQVRVGDGYYGWPQRAPFDGIMVTAAVSHVPSPLIQQLNPGARLVVPIGLPYMRQELMVVEKDAKGVVRTRAILGVAFVPLTGDRAMARSTSSG